MLIIVVRLILENLSYDDGKLQEKTKNTSSKFKLNKL